MNSTWIVIAILFAILVIGFIGLQVNFKKLMGEHNFVTDYLNNFVEFFAQKEFNINGYMWLTQNSVELQMELGSYGLFAYKPGGTFNYINNYEIINLLPEIRKSKLNPQFGDEKEDLGMFFTETLVRYIGVVEKNIQDYKKGLRNPFAWFVQGVQLIILIPFFILEMFGLLGSSRVRKVSNSGLFKIISGIAALVAFVGSIFTIIDAWDNVTKVIVDFWSKYF